MITNGFDMATILPAFLGRIGWRQPSLAGSPMLDGDNSYSSPRYFTGEDKTYVVGAAGAPVAETSEFQDSSLDGFTYTFERRSIGTLVNGTEWDYVNGGGFKLLKANDVFKQGETLVLHITSEPGVTVPTDPPVSGRVYQDFHPMVSLQRIKEAQEDPAITDAQFNTLLRAMDQQVLTRVLMAIFNRPQLIEHALIHERSYYLLKRIIPNGGNFCGYRIKIGQGNFSAIIDNVSLLFDSVKTFNLYLFNDLIQAPLMTKSVTTVANGQTIVKLDWNITGIEASQLGGIFYLGYFQDDLGTTKAIDEDFSWMHPTKVFSAFPFQSQKVGALDFKRNQMGATYRTYGLNIEMSSYHNFDRVLSQNAGLFDEARGLAMAIEVVEMIKNSPRTSGPERISNEQAQQLGLDVNLAFPTQDFPFMSGLKAQLQRELKRLNDTFFPKPKARTVGVVPQCNQYYQGVPLSEFPPREWS